jgi:hypothetical protein
MSSYWDVYGRLHHKPCVDGVPSSNNGWIYTAYADKLMTIDLNKNSLTECFSECIVKDDRDNRSFLIRSPGKDLPPISRDEILGMAALGLLKPIHLNGWNFSPYLLPKFNMLKLVTQLWELRPVYEHTLIENVKQENGLYSQTYGDRWVFKHRNYFWENYLDQLFRFAFSVPLSDRHFILQRWGKFNLIYWAIAKIDSVIGTPKNGIPWLKYNKSIEAMQAEFPVDHPLRGQ